MSESTSPCMPKLLLTPEPSTLKCSATMRIGSSLQLALLMRLICVQILASDFGSKDWNSDEEDGFDPYWGVVHEGEFSEAYIKKHAGFLLRQLTPLLGRHAPKCGLLKELSSKAQIPLDDLVLPGNLSPF